MLWRHEKTRHSDVMTLSYETIGRREIFTDIQKVMLNHEHNMKLYYTGSGFITK